MHEVCVHNVITSILVSPSGSSGSFSRRVREEGNYTLRVNATDSDNNRVIDAKNVRVDFD